MTTELAIAGGTLAAAVSGAMYYAAGVPSSQVFGPSLVRAEGAGGGIALTFDDGPSESTPAILDVLAKAGAKATFFQLGANALRLPDLARRVASEGHEIGSHTQTHPRFYLCTSQIVGREIEQGHKTIETVHGRKIGLFRPPYGARWFGMYPAIRRLGVRSVMWSISSRDWEKPANWIAQFVAGNARPGDVVLMHDGDTTTPGDRRHETATALQSILAAFAEKGLHAVTVSDLFGSAG